METDPFTRQRRLSEVGDAGQARLARARVAVGSGSELEQTYLRRAGVGALVLEPQRTPEEFRHEACFRHGPSAAIGADAWRALLHIRRVLEDE